MANDRIADESSLDSAQTVSEEKQQEIMEKYDGDAAVRAPSGIFGKLLAAVAIGMACFHIYSAVFGMMEAQRHRAMHLTFVLILAFLMYPAFKKKERPGIPRSATACLRRPAQRRLCTSSSITIRSF